MKFLFLDERRVVAGKVLHSSCLICVECHKSIGEGVFEQVCLIEINFIYLFIYF